MEHTTTHGALRTESARPEFLALLLCSLCPTPSRKSHDLILNLNKIVDWNAFFQLALNHGVHQAVYHNLAKNGAHGIVPSDVWKESALLYRSLAASNLRQLSKLLQVQESLRSSGIESIAFKGPTQAILDYGDVALRSFGDLDLFFRRSDISAAKEVLLACGFVSYRKNDLDVDLSEIHASQHHELRLIDPKTNILVELHWAFGPQYWSLRFDTEDIFRNSIFAGPLGGKLRVLDCQHRFLALVVQASKARWLDLGKIAGVAQCFNAHPEMDWPRVFRIAQDAGCERILNIALLQIDGLFDLELPAQVKELLAKDHTARLLSTELCEKLLNPQQERPFDWTSTYLRSRENFGDRWPFFVHRLREVVRGDAGSETPSKKGLVGRLKTLFVDYGLLKPIRHLVGWR